MKIHNTEMDIKTAGLLLFLADNSDSNGVVKIGVREISRRTGENPKWVSRRIKELCNVKLVLNIPSQKSVTDNVIPKKVIKCCLSASYGSIKNNIMSQNNDTDEFNKIWKYYRRDGEKGSKTLAYKCFLNLSQKERKELEKSLPYYMAFTFPKFRPMMYRFIKEGYWKTPKEVNGKVIPMDCYRIADVDAFREWFNREVDGTDIPRVAEVTPERHVNLNICYTLYPGLMSKAMKIVKNNEYYKKSARDGRLTFDHIFNPKDLIEICEKGCDE